MIVGAFGLVPFEVSRERVRTIREGKRERGAVFVAHDVMGRPDRIEPMKVELDQVSLEVSLDQALGVVPSAELILLNQYKNLQMSWPLFLGPIPLGEFVITKINETWRRFSSGGVLASVGVTLDLLEDVDGPLAMRMSRALG